MKSLIAVVSILFTVAASAGVNQNSSWKDLRKARSLQGVFFELPQFQLSHGVFVWADEACLDGDTLRPTKNQTRKKCVRWSSSDNSNECIEYRTIRPEIQVSGTRYGCIEYGYENDGDLTCIEYGQKPYSYKTSFDVKVYRNNRMSSDMGDVNNRGRLLFTKKLVVAPCN